MKYILNGNMINKDGIIIIETTYDNEIIISPISNDHELKLLITQRAVELNEKIDDLVKFDYLDWLNHSLKSFTVLRKDDLTEDMFNSDDGDPGDKEIIKAALCLGWIKASN